MLVRKIFVCENPHPLWSILMDENEEVTDEMMICPKCGLRAVAVGERPENDKAVIRIENGVFYDNDLKKYQGEKMYYIIIIDFSGKEHCRAAHPVSWHKLVRHLEQLRDMTIEQAVKYMKREKLTI
ncbi:hypothetical protein U472_08275 [Orenia metallireducens]|uniref:Uncharacterized protein n=1 Tax=Orenia metallireducens TaxID=1413210 RepID=A0A1C0A706_9FIRM|nr:hypothetical protein [Orenia metallireducens]OCL26012.1 hypothetical protein U472_08275 [Orenia metallireducens]